MKNVSQDGNMELYVVEPGDNISFEHFIKESHKTKGSLRTYNKEKGVTRKEFYAILDKASQPIKHENKSKLDK
jgi:hypothetical protein